MRDITLCPHPWSPLGAGGEVDLEEARGEEEVGEVVVKVVGVVLVEEAEEEKEVGLGVVVEEGVAVVLVEGEEEVEINLPGKTRYLSVQVFTWCIQWNLIFNDKLELSRGKVSA